jgi:hypothetical protein
MIRPDAEEPSNDPYGLENGDTVEVIVPKVPDERLLTGKSKLGWFKTLKKLAPTTK